MEAEWQRMKHESDFDLAYFPSINWLTLVNKSHRGPRGSGRDCLPRPRPRNLNGGKFSPAPENFEILPLVWGRGRSGTGSNGNLCRP